MLVEFEVSGNLDNVLINNINHLELDSIEQLNYYNKIIFSGDNISIEKLTLDGIDTRHFVHYGFTSAGHRGHCIQGAGQIWYYFRLPVWQWYMDFIEYENSQFRKLSQAYSGFSAI